MLRYVTNDRCATSIILCIWPLQTHSDQHTYLPESHHITFHSNRKSRASSSEYYTVVFLREWYSDQFYFIPTNLLILECSKDSTEVCRWWWGEREEYVRERQLNSGLLWLKNCMKSSRDVKRPEKLDSRESIDKVSKSYSVESRTHFEYFWGIWVWNETRTWIEI